MSWTDRVEAHAAAKHPSYGSWSDMFDRAVIAQQTYIRILATLEARGVIDVDELLDGLGVARLEQSEVSRSSPKAG